MRVIGARGWPTRAVFGSAGQSTNKIRLSLPWPGEQCQAETVPGTGGGVADGLEIFSTGVEPLNNTGSLAQLAARYPGTTNTLFCVCHSATK